MSTNNAAWTAWEESEIAYERRIELEWRFGEHIPRKVDGVSEDKEEHNSDADN